MLVRFEVDCIEANQDDLCARMEKSTRLGSGGGGLGPAKKFDDAESSTSLHYIEHGRFDKDQTLVELTSKSTGSRFPRKKWDQLFFSRTDTLILGWHNQGLLQRIEKLTLDQVENSVFFCLIMVYIISTKNNF